MDNVQIPQGYQQVMPYLIINGAPKFIAFMEKVFDAKETMRHMRDDAHIMHGELKIGECTIMFADCTDQYGVQQAGLFIYVQDADKTYQAALEAGAVSVQEVSDQSYGRSGGVKDPVGNVWWITSVIKP